ncbi:response regulator [Scytonema sp. UIC 10036]|uniref:response regulator n=1 Tax=Scytonema sp. UIC 10036 TaxID=2304196 RepID=UPI0012DA5260|nr:response regulator [Scytonema sp. UIC 10036]MUG99978.1 response regulator [Scytonema sp. UIC 10036]
MNAVTNLLEKGTILIVDDTPDNLNLLSSILSKSGYKVHPAPSSKLALRFIQSNLPDLILLDIMMPGMDGYEVCNRLKASPRTQDIPIIFISALHEIFDKVKAFSLGGVDYIIKPFESQEVLARVENQLRLRRLSKELLEQNLKLTAELEERKRIEEALREQKELLQTIFDHIPVMLTLYDNEGRFHLVNREFQRLLGISQEEIHQINILEELFPDSNIRTLVLEHMIAATGRWQDFKLRNRWGNYVDTSWANIRLNHDTIVGIGQDITERKQAEDASVLEERNRMAREIHDTLAQAFTGILVHLGAASRVMEGASEEAKEHIKTVRDLARRGLTEARRSVEALRPQLLEDGDLCSALNRLTMQMHSYSNTRIICEVTGEVYSLRTDIENNLLRIAQEALTNAVKYAKASEIRVEMIYEQTRCLLKIKDDGRGFDTDSASVNNSYGLLGMRERAQHIGGNT